MAVRSCGAGRVVLRLAHTILFSCLASLRLLKRIIMYKLMKRMATGSGRSRFAAGWAAARKAHLKDHPHCMACGYAPLRGSNDVHHIVPRHVAPDRIDDSTNLITLCSKYKCHLRFGHFGNFRWFWNESVETILHQGQGVLMRFAERKHKREVRGG